MSRCKGQFLQNFSRGKKGVPMHALNSLISISAVLFAEVTQPELTSDSAGFGCVMEQALPFQIEANEL